MVYFLGKDCEVYLTTETTTGAFVSTGTTDAMTTTSGSNIFFAGLLSEGFDSIAVLDLTGVDLSIGAVDEDISYFGFRSVTKAEIKKETTVSLTHKKSDSGWDAVYDGGRYGVAADNSFTANALRDPTALTGYRIHVVLKSGSEVFTVPNACVQSHSTSINADGTSEETLEFMSYVSPNVGNVAYTTATTTAEL